MLGQNLDACVPLRMKIPLGQPLLQVALFTHWQNDIQKYLYLQICWACKTPFVVCKKYRYSI